MQTKNLLIITALLAVFTYPLSAEPQGEEIEFTRAAQTTKSAGDSSVYQGSPSQPYDMVFIDGELPAGTTGAEIYNTAKQSWEKMHVKVYPNRRFWAKFSYPSLQKEQIRIRPANGRGTLVVYNMDTDNSTIKPETPAPTKGPQMAIVLPPLGSPNYKQTIISRQQWNAKPSVDPYSPQSPMMITIHHTATRQTLTLEDSMQEVYFIQDFHQQGRKWSDIAYHFLIDASGNIFEGRPVNAEGAHTSGHNPNNIGISMIGNYDVQIPTEASMKALDGLITSLMEFYKIKSGKLYAHREFNPHTKCPGDNLYDAYVKERAQLKANELKARKKAKTGSVTVKKPRIINKLEDFKF